MFRYFIGVVDHRDYYKEPDIDEGDFDSKDEANTAMKETLDELKSSYPTIVITDSFVYPTQGNSQC